MQSGSIKICSQKCVYCPLGHATLLQLPAVLEVPIQDNIQAAIVKAAVDETALKKTKHEGRYGDIYVVLVDSSKSLPYT
ncbi:hypothetical protein ACJMK2_001277, partial [Sinanodonta woodiana]